MMVVRNAMRFAGSIGYTTGTWKRFKWKGKRWFSNKFNNRLIEHQHNST